MRKVLPIILAIIGIGGGVGAGIYLKPADVDGLYTADCVAPEIPGEVTVTTQATAEPSASSGEFVKMSNQFVVPVVADDRISALVVLSLSLQVDLGTTESIYRSEPKLRDSFLQVLFDHANIGGFRGAFTQANNMAVLRRALLETARKAVGATVQDVLITEIVRQDS